MTTDVIDTGVGTIRNGVLVGGLPAGTRFAAAPTAPWRPRIQVTA
ncbi:hypothetical protein [Microbacterium sp. JZ31]|nr:hypothetical protein [Microbacterium sp. JZ31]